MLKGKNAIITGARRGIGRATVETFARNGANIWACARSQDDAFEQDMQVLSKEYGVWINPIYFDITNELEMRTAVMQIRASAKNVDILANVAGVTSSALFLMTSSSDLHNQIEHNFIAPFLFTQYIVRIMLKNPSKSRSIINVSSSAAIDANAGKIAYGASKAALSCMTCGIAQELGGYGIRSNVVAPGFIDTEMAHNNTPQKILEETIQRTDLQRIGTPLDVANLIAFLASDYSAHITGQVIRIDGGM